MSQLYNTVPSFESQVNTLVIWKVVPIYVDKGGGGGPGNHIAMFGLLFHFLGRS